MTWKRVATAAVLIPVVVSAVWWGPTWLVGMLVGLVMVVALAEFFAVAEKAGTPGFRAWTICCSAMMLTSPILARIQGPEWSLWATQVALWVGPMAFLAFFVGLVPLALAPRKGGLENPATRVGVSLAGLFFVALPLLALFLLIVGEPGRSIGFFVLCVVWAGDTAAYFVGRAIGRHKLAPTISPGKTWEGAAANVAASLAVGYLFARWVPMGLAHMLVMSGLASVAGQVGDLFESACKRAAGVKDSGTLLPGHGGMWDRIDALIFAAPAVAWYLAIMRN